MRSRVGPVAWAPAVEGNPLWDGIAVEGLVELADGADYNHGSQTLVVRYLESILRQAERPVLLLDVACGNGRLYRGLRDESLLDRIEYQGADLSRPQGPLLPPEQSGRTA